MAISSPSILVVDDEIDICQNLADILQDIGYFVETAQNGRDALELIRSRPYDIALLDLKMPEMDGLTLYHKIREERAGTVAIIITAYAATDTADDALRAGAWQVLNKPVDLRLLLQFLEEAVRQPLLMIVDDDHDLCSSLWDLLREGGYRVCLAHDEQAAIKQLDEQIPDVVLVDLKLPGGDGREVLQHIRSQRPDARTILISGHREELDQLVEQNRGNIDAVCQKPFDMPVLLQTITRLIERKS